MDLCRTAALPQAIVFVFAAMVSAAQAPPATAPESDPATAPPKLVYSGQPLIVPLECRPEDFRRVGLVCGERTPCELFLELVGLGQTAGRVFLIGNIHTSAATISSILLMSDDGAGWREPLPRIGGAGLDLIEFLDSDRGWIGGQQWQSDHAARPFLLATTDGGRHWDRHEVWDGRENRSGSIAEFFFDTPQHGLLIIDRATSAIDPNELYESMNGGRSWSIRQISSQPLTIDRGPVERPEPHWRLREDAATGTYEIESRQGSGWATSSRFGVHVGSCHSMEATVPFQADAPDTLR